MSQGKVAVLLAVVLGAAFGCSGGDAPAPSGPAPTPPKLPPTVSAAKAAGGGGAAQFVGGAPEGSGFKKGPPVVGQKVGGGG